MQKNWWALDNSQVRSLSQGTEHYYDAHAGEYTEKTRHVDMSAVYEKFVGYVTPGGRILDVGCGPGRDLKHFHAMGFDVVGIDSSEAMVEAAEAFAGVPCHRMRMESLSYRGEFDGIWCCASLLHLPKSQVAATIAKLWTALRTPGVIYVAVKKGIGEELLSDGRFFASYEADEFEKVLLGAAPFSLQPVWETVDASARSDLTWLNFLATK